MSNYTKSTNFATKDNLTPGDPLKIVRGTEIDTEYNNIAIAIATKTDNASAAITGGTITGITDLAIADGGTGASTANAALNNLLPSQTSASGKYLKSNGTDSSWDDLDISTADITGTLPVANGGTGVTTSTGTGSNVLSNSPTLVTPNLGTPASGVATNLTGLPLTTGVTGTLPVANGGTGVTTSTGTGSTVLSNSPTLVTPALGTPSSATLTNATGLPINTGVSGLATGIATFLATPSSANLAAALTDETGTGANVFANSPTLVTPALGTPSSATLTNATGLPISTGVSGLGTGVATALAVNVGSAGAPVVNGGVLGTPSSGTATNLTGLPLTTGVTGTLPVLNGGTGVTTSTGSGSNVLSTSPTLVTPVLGTPTSVSLTNATGLPISTGVSGLGTGVATALAVNVGSAGAVVVNGGALGTPSSGTVTNLTGTASININGTVGATTPTTGAFTTVTENTYAVVSQADIGSAANKIPLNQYLGSLAYKNTIGMEATSGPAPTIASAATIQPLNPITFVSGTTTINTITVPNEFAVGGGQITLIPTGLWSTGTSGNIAIATTGVVSKALILFWDATTAKWYPSY